MTMRHRRTCSGDAELGAGVVGVALELRHAAEQPEGDLHDADVVAVRDVAVAQLVTGERHEEAEHPHDAGEPVRAGRVIRCDRRQRHAAPGSPSGARRPPEHPSSGRWAPRSSRPSRMWVRMRCRGYRRDRRSCRASTCEDSNGRRATDDRSSAPGPRGPTLHPDHGCDRRRSRRGSPPPLRGDDAQRGARGCVG